MGEVVRIVELAERMIRLRGLRPYMDIQIQFTGIRPGEKMHEELFSQLENPCPTEHPSILKAETWDVDFQSDAFWEKIDGLLEISVADGDVTLERIRAIISPNLAAALNGQHDAVKALWFLPFSKVPAGGKLCDLMTPLESLDYLAKSSSVCVMSDPEMGNSS